MLQLHAGIPLSASHAPIPGPSVQALRSPSPARAPSWARSSASTLGSDPRYFQDLSSPPFYLRPLFNVPSPPTSPSLKSCPRSLPTVPRKSNPHLLCASGRLALHPFRSFSPPLRPSVYSASPALLRTFRPHRLQLIYILLGFPAPPTNTPHGRLHVLLPSTASPSPRSSGLSSNSAHQPSGASLPWSSLPPTSSSPSLSPRPPAPPLRSSVHPLAPPPKPFPPPAVLVL